MEELKRGLVYEFYGDGLNFKYECFKVSTVRESTLRLRDGT